ncbi:ras-related protein Rab-6A-like isoform X2 [Parasteatoda tepidariorum]|uniref:ras-related protein Rab-6A-like isoform X2 n=1 Tax=Parasteatoda tepidariorum TaxID=114398 RepID=UPI001C726146|nr:ras-related protein Rab-6A-like isoform X2 [Parasteatoda tepidariorum]
MGNKTNRTSNITNGMDNESQQFKLEFGFNIVLLGESENFNQKWGYHYFFKQLKVKDKDVELFIGVIGGQKRYRRLVPRITQDAHGILLLYDTANIRTFEKLREWREIMRDLAPEAIIFIIGARSDLFHRREVLFEEGQNFAKSENLEFFECSAKTGENVKEIFEQMTLRILEKEELISFIHPFEIEIEGKSPE